jgi:hypothetical protein
VKTTPARLWTGSSDKIVKRILMKLRAAVLQHSCLQDTSFMKIGHFKFTFLCVNEFTPAFLETLRRVLWRFGAENLNTVPRENCVSWKSVWGGGESHTWLRKVSNILAVFFTLFDLSARGLAQTMSKEMYFVMHSASRTGAFKAIIYKQAS